jgi:colanic acid/amylovoran biosynthesis glycosyltransferase
MKKSLPNIIEVTYNWPPEIFIQRHATALLHAGFRVKLVSRHSLSQYQKTASVGAEEADIQCNTIPNFDHLSFGAKLWNLHYLFPNQIRFHFKKPLRDQVLLAFFRRLKPDLIHFHTADLAAIMHWVPESLCVPYTISLRGSDIQVMPLRSPETAFGIRNALIASAGIHAVCRRLGEEASEIAKTELDYTTIYTTVPVPKELPSRKNRKKRDAPIRLLTVGRLHWRKGFPDLLYSLRLLLDSGIKATLTIIGNGAEESRIRYWIHALNLKPHVVILGKQDASTVQKRLMESDAYIQSSIGEGFSNAVAEAMAYGCPVFATDVGGTSELIQDGENGFLLQPLRPETWPAVLLKIQDSKRIQQIRLSAHQSAQKYFKPENHANQFIQFYLKPIQISPRLVPSSSFREIKSVVSQEKKRILVHGSLAWQTGTDLIIRALSKTVAPVSVKLFLVGSGSQEDELRYLCQSIGFTDWSLLPLKNQSVIASPDLSVTLPDGVDGFWQLKNKAGKSDSVCFGKMDSLTSKIQRMLIPIE